MLHETSRASSLHGNEGASSADKQRQAVFTFRCDLRVGISLLVPSEEKSVAFHLVLVKQNPSEEALNVQKKTR